MSLAAGLGFVARETQRLHMGSWLGPILAQSLIARRPRDQRETHLILAIADHFEPARRSLQRAIYLNQDFVLGHYALGNLARECDRLEEADKHFTSALQLLKKCEPGELLPESDGLTAARLTEIINSIATLEAAP